MTARLLRVAHTGVTVSDLDRAMRFFGDVLGAEVSQPIMADLKVFERITGLPGARIRIAFADLPGHRVELLEYLSPEGRTTTARPCDPGHLHLALEVDGIEEFAERMRAAGFAPVGPVQQVVERTGNKAVYTVGFDNITIELMWFHPGPWTPVERQD